MATTGPAQLVSKGSFHDGYEARSGRWIRMRSIRSGPFYGYEAAGPRTDTKPIDTKVIDSNLSEWMDTKSRLSPSN